MEKTVFSKIIDRELPAHIVWEDAEFCAFLDRKPITPGHTLLVPKRLVGYIFDMEDANYQAIWEKARWLAGHIRLALKSERIGIMVEGFRVPHVHIHLVPINNGNDLNPDGASAMGSDELLEYCQRIRSMIINPLQQV